MQQNNKALLVEGFVFRWQGIAIWGRSIYLLASSRTPAAQESCATDQQRAQDDQSSSFGKSEDTFHVMEFEGFCESTTTDHE